MRKHTISTALYLKKICLILFLYSTFAVLSSCTSRNLPPIPLEGNGVPDSALLPVSTAASVQGEHSADTAILHAFRFSDAELLQLPHTTGTYAVELTLSASAADYAAACSFSLSFLYDEDFSSYGMVTTPHAARPAVTGQCPQPTCPLTVSIGLPAGKPANRRITGLLLTSTSPIMVQRAALTPARYGWQKTAQQKWCGFTAQGGQMPPVLFQTSPKNIETVFTPVPFPPEAQPIAGQPHARQTAESQRVRTILKLYTGAYKAPDSWETAPVISIHTGTKRIKIRPVPHLREYTIDTAVLDSAAEHITISEHTGLVTGIVVETQKTGMYDPITADTGLLLDWQQSAWRNPRYEFFSWELFPSVLVFDCADYLIQDRFFKRLSFFAEKKGYTGRLLTDKELQQLHGFNAHDYGAQTLADFFQLAETSAFPLTAEEAELKEILLHNGIIYRQDGRLCTGTGAVVSISRESPPYLRTRFITHECLHGIYFTEERFRAAVDTVFYAADPRAVKFLRRYFELTDSLNYNTDNEYLLKNEFMAYILQQKAARIPAYFAQTLSYRSVMNKHEPALCRYIRKTKAQDFVHAAEKLNAFLYAIWGIQGGLIQCITLEE